MIHRVSRSFRLAVVPVLLVLGACDNPVDHEDDHHDDIVGVEVTSTAGAAIATFRQGAWSFTSGDALHLHPGEEVGVKIFFVTTGGDRVQFPLSGSEHTLRVQIADTAIATYAAHGDHGDFRGKAAGEATARIQVYHGGHADYETNPGLPIEVVAHGH